MELMQIPTTFLHENAMVQVRGISKSSQTLGRTVAHSTDWPFASFRPHEQPKDLWLQAKGQNDLDNGEKKTGQ